ncbi:MAG: exopolysaccharide biosynthesis protein [Paracoccaceae bacterium]
MSDSRQSRRPVGDVVDRLDELSGQDSLTLGAVVRGFGRSSYLTALLVPALLVASPLSGIPGFSALCGLTVALIAVQLFFAKEGLWMPGVLARRSVDPDKLGKAVPRLRRVADWLDRHSHDRLRWLVVSPGRKLPQGLLVLGGLLMPLLEFIPFSGSVMGVAMILVAVGLLARDGLYVVTGMVVMGVVAGIPVFVFNTVLPGVFG